MSGTLTKAPVIKWAIEESGYSLPELVQKMESVQATESMIQSWIGGESTPTRGQLTQLAKVLRRPAAVFYRSEPPQSDSKLLQLRTGRGTKNRSLTPDERFQVREARRRQRWISELLSDESPVDIPSFNGGVSATTAAARLRQWCEMDIEQVERWDSDHDGYLAWKRALESRGVLVMELQLGRDGMRGFSLADPYAPAVAVNTIENAAGRSFTLWHEVAHLTRSDTSSCLVSDELTVDESERWCDQVASEVLLPKAVLADFCTARPTAEGIALVRAVAERFRTSLRATAVALETLDRKYDGLYALVNTTVGFGDSEKAIRRSKKDLNRRPQRRLREISSVGSRAVIDALVAERISERSARRILRLDGSELGRLRDLLEGLE